MDPNKDAPFTMLVSQRNQDLDDPIQVEFLKRFYNNIQINPDKVHPSLLTKLQKNEQKDQDKNCFLVEEHNIDEFSFNSNFEKDFSERSCVKQY